MEQVALKKRYSQAEYFALEVAHADTKHEYFDGEIFAMAGAHPNHNTVCVNLVREIGNQLIRNGKPCRVYNSDQRVRAFQSASDKTGYFYPDVTVVCGKPEFSDDNPPTLLNPTVIIEVLSESTRPYDFGKKLDYYRSVHSVQEVLFVSYDRVHLSLFCRKEQEWVLRDVSNLSASVAIPSLDIELPLAEIYRDLELPSPRT
ncbi:MAG: Uma2 family endonuclease [Chloroherpetonaceae bacterium]|nr:Uma2 family endonuclease [Chloroherpetonaceae bacterium]MDW8019615.1 Uma2 family endonuclease [Chloroherpetonaceae bacterium]